MQILIACNLPWKDSKGIIASTVCELVHAIHAGPFSYSMMSNFIDRLGLLIDTNLRICSDSKFAINRLLHAMSQQGDDALCSQFEWREGSNIRECMWCTKRTVISAARRCFMLFIDETLSQQRILHSTHTQRECFECGCDTTLKALNQYETMRYKLLPKIALFGSIDKIVEVEPKIHLYDGSCYKLLGACVSIKGHTTAFVRKEEIWYNCDDTNIQPCAEEEVLGHIKTCGGNVVLAAYLRQ